MAVKYHNITRSPAIETLVSQQTELLHRFYTRITDCQVTIEVPHLHHHQGKRFKVTITISVPGDTLTVSHENENDPAHEDCYLTIHDAFRSARRQLQDFARIQRGQARRNYRSEKRKFRSRLVDDDRNEVD